MDTNLDPNNISSSRGVYSPMASNNNPKDGHTPSDTELSKECIEGVRKLVESFENYTVDSFIASFKANYNSLKLFLLKYTNDEGMLQLKTQCYDLLESYTKIELSESQIKRELLSICLNTLMTSSDWDEVCHRILKSLLSDPKQFINILQIEQFFEYTSRLLTNYPNLHDKDVKRLVIFINLLELLFSTPLSTKNLVQLLPVLTKVINLNSKDHIEECYVELVKLSCSSLHLFNTNVKHSVNYTYYINDIYTHLIYLVNSTNSVNIAQLTRVINVFIIFVSSVVNKVLFKSIFESEIYNKLYSIAKEQYSLRSNVLLLIHEIVKKIDVEQFNIVIFEKCCSLISRYWLSTDHRLRELCYNLMLDLTGHASKAISNLDEEAQNRVYKFSVISFFNATNFISDMYYTLHKMNIGFISYVKGTMNQLLELILLNYKLLIQQNRVKRIMTVNVLKTFILVIKIIFRLYGTLTANREVKMDKQDEEKNEYLYMLDNAVRMVCKTLEYPYTVDGIRILLPLLIHQYLNPGGRLIKRVKSSEEGEGDEQAMETDAEAEEMSSEELMEQESLALYVLYSFSRLFPDLFLQQYLSLFVYLLNNDNMEELYRYSYRVLFQSEPDFVEETRMDNRMVEKLLNENIFVGLKYNVDSMKYISNDLNFIIGILYNYYPRWDGLKPLDDQANGKTTAYFRLLTAMFNQINKNVKCSYMYEHISTLNKFLDKMIFYFKLSDCNHLELMQRGSSSAYVDIEENEDLYTFLFVISMRNTEKEYMKVMLKLVNYVFNYVDSVRLLKQALLLLESYAEYTEIQELYYMLSNQIRPANDEEREGDWLNGDESEEDQGTEPYFIKLFLRFILEKGEEVGAIVLSILGKLGNLSQKYTMDTYVKGPEEFTLAFASASKKDFTIVSMPVEQGLDAMTKRLMEICRSGTVTLKVEDFDSYCGYLLVAMAPVLQYNTSLTQFYVNMTAKSTSGSKSVGDGMDVDGYEQTVGCNKSESQELEKRQYAYMKKLFRCLCLLLNTGTKLNTLESNEFENLVSFKNVLVEYAFLSSPDEKNRDNLMLLVSLLVSCLDYRATVGASEDEVEELEDSCVDMLLEVFERAVEEKIEDVIDYYVELLLFKLNEKSVYKRISTLVLLVHLLKIEASTCFESYHEYIYNATVRTLEDHNKNNDEFMVDKKKRMWEENVAIAVLRLLIERNPEFAFENLTALLNSKGVKMRILAFELLEEYEKQKLVHFFNNNYKNLDHLEIVLLSTKYTQNHNCMSNALMKLSNHFNNFTDDTMDTVVYLAVLELVVFDGAFEKMFKQMQADLLENLLTGMINLTMMSIGVVFNLSYSLLKRMDKIQINQNVMLTLQPYIIQLQTIFNNMTVKKLKMFFDIYGSDMNYIKESLYDVAGTISESKINVSELQMINYMNFFKFLKKLGYNDNLLVKHYLNSNNVTTPIMLFQLYENYVLPENPDAEREGDTERENRVLDEMKLYDMMYLMDEAAVTRNFHRLNSELEDNNMNVIYEVLCYLEYLSNTRSILVSTKEFKNTMKTVVNISNPDIFLGHFIHKDGMPYGNREEEEKDLDEILYMLISNKCYQLLQLHYPSTADVLRQYNYTSYHHLETTNEDLALFNKYILDNLEFFEGLYLSKSTSDYLYSTKLLTLMRMVHLVNNKEDVVKGTMMTQLMNYVCYNVLRMRSENDDKMYEDVDEFDETLCQWLGYYMASKICHVNNINYMIVTLIYKNYISFLKSTEFEYVVTNLQSVPMQLFLVLNNRMERVEEEDLDDFDEFYKVMKSISLNFFSCLCNLTMCETVDNNKNYVPVILYMFDLANMPLLQKSDCGIYLTTVTGSSGSASHTPDRRETQTYITTSTRAMSTVIVVLGSFIAHLTNYRNLMYEYLLKMIEFVYKNMNYNYYHIRFALELMVGIMVIFEKNQLEYDMLHLITVYIKLLSNFKLFISKYAMSKHKDYATKMLYRYNGIISKLYGYELLDYVHRESNTELYKNILLKLLKNEYPKLDVVSKRMVEIPYFTNNLSVKGLMSLKAASDEDNEEDKNNSFLEMVMNMMLKYLETSGHGGDSGLSGASASGIGSTGSGVGVDPVPGVVGTVASTLNAREVVGVSSITNAEEERFHESVNMAILFIEIAKRIDVKSVKSLMTKSLPLLISKIEENLLLYSQFNMELDDNFMAFIELSLLMVFSFEEAQQKALLKIIDSVTRYHKHYMYDTLVGLYYIEALGAPRGKQSSKLKRKEHLKVEDGVVEDRDYNFYDYTGNYIELTRELLDKYVITDITTPNKRPSKVALNHSKYTVTQESAEESTRDLFKYVNYNLEGFKYELICRIMYHTRHISYPFTPTQEPTTKNMSSSMGGESTATNNSSSSEDETYQGEDGTNDEEELRSDYNHLYLRVVRDERFKNVRHTVRVKCLTHCSYLAKLSLVDPFEYHSPIDTTYHTMETLFKYENDTTALLNTLFTLFDQDIETGISINYPRFRQLGCSKEGHSQEEKQRDKSSQINFICNSAKMELMKPIVSILKDFRMLSLSNREGSVEEGSSNEGNAGFPNPWGRVELELTLDSKLHKALKRMNEFHKLYFERYLNVKHASGYVRKVCELHKEVGDAVFTKLFQQLYINLSEPYRNELFKQILLFIVNKINSLSMTNHQTYQPVRKKAKEVNPYLIRDLTQMPSRETSQSTVKETYQGSGSFIGAGGDQTRGHSYVDAETMELKRVLNLVYVTVINSYPLIVLPVEIIKYLGYYLDGNYFNTCYYLEKLMLTQPLDITRIASVLSDIYMKLDMMDMSIGSNRCWVITSETRLALANLQHSKWKQAQREFNQIMEYLGASGQSSETVAWFDESKLWFNYWLYCTKQLGEWDSIRDMAYVSNNKLLFNQSNVYLNTYPHVYVPVTSSKDNITFVSEDPSKDIDTMEVDNVLEMNLYNVISRASKVFNSNTASMGALHKHYTREYQSLRMVLENSVGLLLQYYRNTGSRLNSGHVNCMRMNQRFVEASEGLAYLKRVTDSVYASQNAQEAHLINRWRARLPNKSDHPLNWTTMLAFRTMAYSSVKNLLNLHPPFSTQSENLYVNQDYIWTLVKYSCVTRKTHQLPLMASVLLNKAQKFLVSTMNRTVNMGEDYYLLINEKFKQYLSFSVNMPEALKSIISLDFEKLPNKGFETLKAHVTRLKAEAINRNYIYDSHQAQANPNKRPMSNSIGDIDLACKYMLESLKLQPLLSKNWISWAKFNDNKIDHSLISVWSKSEQMFPMELYETAIMGYLTAISINPNCHWLLIKRIFTLLGEMHRAVNGVSESFKKYSEYINHCVWLTWLPQLVKLLHKTNNAEVYHLLKVLATKVPQQLHYTLRTEYLSLLANGVSNNGVMTKEENYLGEEKSPNSGDVKTILHALLNSNPTVNHNLESFCNLLTNMGKPDVIDEILCAYETIFEECLDLPFHENIPKPMLHCITNKILGKLSSARDRSNTNEDEELYNLVHKFTQDFVKQSYSSGSNSSSQNSDRSQINIPCGYAMNKLLDMITALVNYTKKRKTRNSNIQYLLNHSVCNVSNNLATAGSTVIQLPHVKMNGLDEILRNKNVLGEIHEVLYVDPRVLKVRRRNQVVKCIKIVTTDGQNHYYSLCPLLRVRQKNEEYLHQMTQLLNFYFKKYHETLRRNVRMPSSVVVPLDPYICLVEDNPRNQSLLTIYNNAVSLNNLMNPSSVGVSLSGPPTGTNTPNSSRTSRETLREGSAATTAFNDYDPSGGYETNLLILVLHKILLEKNITSKLYECYNKYNPGQLQAISANLEDDRNVGFNYIYKMFKDKQYPWFLTWYRKIHQDVLQDAYNKLCNIVPDNILVSQLQSASADYQAFITIRMNFTSTYATQAMLSLVLATPYTTPSRLMLNPRTGTIKQLDYRLFTREMEPNKLRVFRLTRNMSNLIGPTCRLGLMPAVMFSVTLAMHHFKIDIHAALSAILERSSAQTKAEPGDAKENAKDGSMHKDKEPASDKADDVDEYLSKLLNYCTYLRAPADQEHSTVPINNMIVSIIDASTDSSMLGKLKTSYLPWF